MLEKDDWLKLTTAWTNFVPRYAYAYSGVMLRSARQLYVLLL